MNIAEIESGLRDLVEKPFDPASFPFDFIELFDVPKATITKLRQGSANQATRDGDVLWKNKVFFRPAQKGKAAQTVDAMVADPLVKRHAPRFVMSTDGAEFYCRDTKSDQSLDIGYAKLNDAFDFFLPLAGIERYEGVAENPADIKATGRLAKLYDAILEANPDWAGRDHTHELNLFMTRLLFCFFAEDTAIFETGLFTNTVMSFTNDDGGNVAPLLTAVFGAMDTPPEARGGMKDYVAKFPYVNGGLFRDRVPVPKFNRRARRLLQECGGLAWQDINPDIFGSMIQAVVEPGMRGDLGMHYTSVPNVMKVLQPLFLMSLEEEFEAARDSEAKLRKLLDRIHRIRVFDPACGSGNFLIIAYRELRKIENRIFARLNEVSRQAALPMSGIRLSNFFGIELADFAAETAKLSLWIAEYQANEQFKALFGKAPPALPLKDSGKIVHDNALRVDWLKVCPPDTTSEIFIVGNPPYLGRPNRNEDQQADLDIVFQKEVGKFKNLDYVACWFLKAANYGATTKAKSAFVATNSICQGEQVPLLWPAIFKKGMEIGFAHQSFKWKNNAAKNAGVTCVIIGIRPLSVEKRRLYDDTHLRLVSNIGPYLTEADNLIVDKASRSISGFPKIELGSAAKDGNNLSFSRAEVDKIIGTYPNAEMYFKRIVGSQEFINGDERWCAWIPDHEAQAAKAIPPLRTRIEAVAELRRKSKKEATVKSAEKPHAFDEIRYQDTECILIPRITSERRKFIPVGIFPSGTVVSDQAFAIYGPAIHMMSIVSSTLHCVWIKAVCGQLETRVRYSNNMGYNTFPLPTLSAGQRTQLEDHAIEILGAREAHPGKTIAWLYDPDTMPANLLAAHRALDETLETIYIGRPFKSDTERLEHLFKLYAAKIKGAA